MKTENLSNWDNATWKGSRMSQLRVSLRLSYQQRFEALEDFSNTSDWLANAKTKAKSVPQESL